MIKFFKTVAAKKSIFDKEYSVSGFIPYKYHWNDHTIINDSNELFQVIKFGGYSFETADDDDVDIRKNIRNLLFKGISSGSFSIYFHIVRRRQSVFTDDEMDLSFKAEGGFAAYVDKKWKEKHASKNSFINDLYLTVVRKPSTQGVASVETFFKKYQQKADKKSWEIDMRDAYEELDEITARILTTLRDYNPKMLGSVRTNDGVYSEILEFFGRIVNCGFSSKMLVPTADIASYIANQRLYFGRRAVEVRGAGGSRFAGIISIKEYSQHTSATMLDSFLQLPFEFIISQSFSFINRQSAVNAMKIQQNRMIQAEDVAVSQIAEINEALDDAMSGRIGFGKHHLTVLCIEDSIKSLEIAISMASTELSNAGLVPVRETINMEPAYWAQLPGNAGYAVRKSTVNTLNLASFASLHNYPVGSKEDNHWGDHVTVLDTTSGTPFYFNFHVRDVGHTTIIGPTGSGKTVLMNFLCAQAQKFNCRMFFFDKDRGAEIFIRALGGVYNIIDPGNGCGFNPLQLEDSGENRNFISEWLRLLVSTNKEPLSAEDTDRINDAINGNYKLSKEDRVLGNIVPFLGLAGPDTLAGRISMWHGNGSHAKVFDNAIDKVDFSKSNIFAFEMAELLKDRVALGPVLLYIFHRINASLDGTPTMIVLDEAWALIDNDVFAPKIKDWLKVLRKLNCFVIFATQSVEDASRSGISDTLIQQTATQIFLPNLKATDVYRTHFMLSEREYALIKTTNPASRFFLVKQNTDAVVARIDLSGMEDVISVLSGRVDTVRLLDEIRKEVGDDPDDWLPVFWERVKDVK